MSEAEDGQVWDIDQTDSDETESDDNLTYEISHYPADITLEGYKSRFEKGTLRVPKFQRNYVWDQVRASKLIESFLLGLPVPGVFLYKERKSNHLLIIDGQQRIMSAIKFLSEKFDQNRVFKLKSVREPWNGKSFSELSEADQSQLENMVLRATIIQQIDPLDDSSVYHIFERLNTGGIRLNAMEVRKCIYEGHVFDLMEELNTNADWRSIIGRERLDPRLRDVELVLRVLALAENSEAYEKPMKVFLNKYLSEKRRMDPETLDEFIRTVRSQFITTMHRVASGLGEKPFHLRGRLNYAFMDAFLAAAMKQIDKVSVDFAAAVEELKQNEEFIRACTYNTSDEAVLKVRFELAQKVVADAVN